MLSSEKLNALSSIVNDRALSFSLFFEPDPARWSHDDVTRWMNWTMSQFNVEPMSALLGWSMNGQRLLDVTEDQFKEKFPQVGSFSSSPP